MFPFCHIFVIALTLSRPAEIGDLKKKHWNSCGFVKEGISPVSTTDPVKVLKDVESLLACTRKKLFAWGLCVFCEWRHKWRTFGHLVPLYLALGANR